MKVASSDPIARMVSGFLAVVGALVAIACAIGVGRGQLRRAGAPAGDPGRLRGAIVGNSKRAVVSVLGPPRVATFAGTRHGSAADYRAADVWYYPLRKDDKLAMAIRFDDERAEAVEFFHAPRA